MTIEPDLTPQPRRTPARSETLVAILFMAAGFFFYSVSDMLAKWLTQSINPLQVAWLRQFGLFVGVLVLLSMKGPIVLRSRNPGLQIARGLTAVVSAICFLYALTYVPIADATAVSFVAPFLVTVLATVLLGEKVGPRRWIAIACGFLGTMIIIRPGLGTFHPAIWLVVVSAVAFAVRQIISRFLSGSDPLTTTVTYTALTAGLALTIPLPFVWTNPTDLVQFLVIVAVAGFAACGEIAIIRALDRGEAVVLSPLQYTLMIWSVLWGALVFAQFPDRWTLIGSAVVIASGIYTFYREARKR